MHLAMPQHFYAAALTSGALISCITLLSCFLLFRQPIEETFFSSLPTEGKSSGLPGNFLSQKLMGICWANAFLQGLCLLDDELKAEMYSISEKSNHFPLVHTVAQLVYKLDRHQAVSISEMEELMDVFERSHFIERDENGYADLHFQIEILLQNFLKTPLINCLFENSKTGEKSIIPRFVHDWRMPVTSLNELIHKGDFEPVVGSLPKTLIIQNLNHTLEHDQLLPNDSEGFYHCSLFSEEANKEVKYTYRLKGIIQHHGSYKHFTTRSSLGNNAYVEYDDARAYVYQKPLRIQKGFIYAFFERID